MILIVSVVINSEKFCIWNNERMILSNNNITKVEITIHILLDFSWKIVSFVFILAKEWNNYIIHNFALIWQNVFFWSVYKLSGKLQSNPRRQMALKGQVNRGKTVNTHLLDSIYPIGLKQVLSIGYSAHPPLGVPPVWILAPMEGCRPNADWEKKIHYLRLGRTCLWVGNLQPKDWFAYTHISCTDMGLETWWLVTKLKSNSSLISILAKAL